MADQPSVHDLFLAEATENLHSINAALLELELEPQGNPEHMKRALRCAHTIKGSAAAAGLSAVQRLMHNFESCAQAVDRGRVPPSSEVFLVLFAFLDAIEAAVHESCNGVAPVNINLPDVLANVEAKFAAHAELLPVELTSLRNNEPKAQAAEVATVRVAISKLDRQMANIEELVQMRADGRRSAEHTRALLAVLEEQGALSRKLVAALKRGRSGQVRTDAFGELVEKQQLAADRALALSQDLYDALRKHGHVLERVGSRLQEDIRSLRLLPAQRAFESFARMVRDLSRKQDKHIDFSLEGGEIEVDRDLLEAIKDPLIHLLRNAVDHGIEAPAVREALGKPKQGRISIRVDGRASGLRVIVTDDGRGLDTDAIRARAVESGLFSRDAAQQLDHTDLQALVFRPGFSTAREVSELSGRGVGLDIVRDRVEALGGTISLESIPGRGATFELRLPLSLSTMRMLIVRTAGEVFAVPATTVERVIRLGREDITRVDLGDACDIDGAPVLVRALEALLGLDGSANTSERRPAVVIRSASRRLALLVDAIEGEQELVVKPLPHQLEGIRRVTGATVLGDGRVVPTLSAADILRELDVVGSARDAFGDRTNTDAVRKRILIVDDSITTRTLEKSVLEAVGYEVEVATDGVDALTRLERGRFDLMLSDVQMPRMDGIELVTQVRSSDRHRALPIVLVSSLAGEDDRKRGLRAGADAYLDKGEFRQELLLETLERLL
jgi:two-component system chemotaxis sensor kinase CheA